MIAIYFFSYTFSPPRKVFNTFTCNSFFICFHNVSIKNNKVCKLSFFQTSFFFFFKIGFGGPDGHTP